MSQPDDLPGEESTPRLPLVVPGILLLVAIGGAADLILDRPTRWLSAHVILEVALMTVSLGASILLWRGWLATRRQLARAEAAIVRRTAERDAWRRNAESVLAGFRGAVSAKFDDWKLTGSEREVALLLLQGLGHKQIAARSGRSERTVRQHAVSIYEKSGLDGRAELAAFFLDGLRSVEGSGPDSTESAAT